MKAYVTRRLLLAFAVLFVVSVAVFMLIRIVPGDVILAQLGDSGSISNEDREKVRNQLGLNRPILVQYQDWMGGVLLGNLGISLWSGHEVADELARTIPVSLELAMIALSVSIVVSIPAGVISARFRSRPIDQAIRLASVTMLGMPEFLIGITLVWSLSRYLQWVPPVGYVSILESPAANLQQFLIPGVLMGLNAAASTIRMTRSTVLEVLGEDYVRTARAKGLAERLVLLRHVLKNALIPVVTIFGNRIPHLLGGVVIIESIFSLPGVGRLTLSAIEHRDYPLLQGTILVLALLVVLANLITDLSYGWLDPRIRLR